MNSFEDDGRRVWGGAFIALLRILSVALTTSVARMAFSLGESCSWESLVLPWVAVLGFTRLLAVVVALGFRPCAVFGGGFDVADDSDSGVFGLLRRRSFSSFGITGVISPVEIALRMASALGESISIASVVMASIQKTKIIRN